MAAWSELAVSLGPQPAAYNGHPWPARTRPTPRYRETADNVRRRRLGQGLHPLVGLPLLLPRGRRCKDCRQRHVRYVAGVLHHKCMLVPQTYERGRTTDCRAHDPACERFVAHTKKEDDRA